MTNEQFTSLVSDITTSTWLLDAIKTSLKRDPIDALADAETLVAVCKLKLQNVTAESFAAILAHDLALLSEIERLS